MNKSIFITGAASGIGEATAHLFHKKGWNVGLMDLNIEKLNYLSSRLSGNHKVYEGDVTNIEDLKSSLKNFTALSDGGLDVLFNSAGTLLTGRFEENSLEDYEKLIQINITGTIKSVYEALPYLRKSDRSTVINMCSASAIYGTPDFAVYSASKFAVKGLTEALNIEFERYNIHVCDIMPSFVDTSMLSSIRNKPMSIEKLGVKLNAVDVSEKVWKAVNSSKIHHLMPLSLKLLSTISRHLPFTSRLVMKALSS